MLNFLKNCFGVGSDIANKVATDYDSTVKTATVNRIYKTLTEDLNRALKRGKSFQISEEIFNDWVSLGETRESLFKLLDNYAITPEGLVTGMKADLSLREFVQKHQ